ATPFAGVVQQITQHLQKIAAITDKACAAFHLDFNDQILMRVHLAHCHSQLSEYGRDLHGTLSERRAPAHGGTLQLAIDDLRHAVDLAIDARALRGVPGGGGTDHAKRCLEAVCQISERVAIASDSALL